MASLQPIRLLFAILLFALMTAQAQAFSLFGEQETDPKVTSGQNSPSIDQVQAEAYNGPKARVAVSRFSNKAGGAWYNGRIGDGMADQLTTALFNTNRFIVLERQTLGDVMMEQDLGASGRVRRDTAAPIGQIEGAELLITGAVTEFQDNASGTRAGGGGLIGNVVGAISGGVQSAHMAIDVRVIDARTSRILAATSVEGKAQDVDIGGAVGGYFGGGALGGALSTWENTPREKALRACIQKAVDFIVAKTPATYYRAPGNTPARRATSPAETKQVPKYAPGAVVRVTSASLNVRSGAGTNNPVVFKAPGGTLMLVLNQRGSWLEVRDQSGRSGWTAGWLVTHEPGMNAASLNRPPPTAPVPPPAAAPAPSAAPPPAATAPATGGGTSDIKKRLQELKELHDAGLITKEEYEAKRKVILQSL